MASQVGSHDSRPEGAQSATPELRNVVASVHSTSCALRLDQESFPNSTSAGEMEEEPVSRGHTPRLWPGIRHILLNFTPSWHSVNMGTGITSILLHQLPYQFRGLALISNLVFGLNVGLFLLFLAMGAARYIIWPTMGPTMLFHSGQSLFLGTLPMGFATIVNMCALSAAPAWTSSPSDPFVTFTWALWWIDSIISLAVCLALPFLQFTRHEHSLKTMNATWFLPVVAPIVASASGAIVADILSPERARLTLIVSWVLWGTGFPLALLLMALFYQRLAIHKIPPSAIIVSCFLPLGPCGQGAFAILKLASSLKSATASAGKSLIAGQDITEALLFANIIYAASIPTSLVLWGLGLVWLTLAISFVVDLALVSKLSFNIGWWGFTFPLGVFCAATIQLGQELNSDAFRIIGTILSVVEILLWLLVSAYTVIGVCTRKLFFSPCLAEQGGEPPKHVIAARKYEY